MHRKILDTIQRHRLLTAGDRVLVAVSGGPDSVALLEVLHRLRKQLGIELALAHLNHGLRGDEADEDERFVRALARRYGLPHRCRKEDVAARRRARGGSLEEVARAARYGFLRRVAVELGANVLALGHTAGDNAETLLMNLLRGAGLHGLAGIPIVRPEGALRLVRPLLEVTRSEVLAYLARRGLEFRTDASNADVELTRNRIRQELLPQLAAQYNPSVGALLARTAEQMRDVAELVDAHVRRAAERFVEPVEAGFALPLRAVRQMPRAVRTELLRGLVTERFGRTLGPEQVRTLERFCRDPSGPHPSIGRGLSCEVVFDRVVIRHARAERQHEAVEVVVPGLTVHPSLDVELAASLVPRTLQRPRRDGTRASLAELWRRVETGELLDLTQEFDADRVLVAGRQGGGDALVLRVRRPGDRMQPIGFDGVKKVQDIFVDEKVPAAVRGKVPLLCRGDEVLWIPGYRIADACKVTDRTEHLLVVRLMLGRRAGRQRGGPESGSEKE
jgi:tRNA(Ile)-lysidine synthase